MAANGPKEEVEWDLDWDDLTEGVPATPPAASGVEGIKPSEASSMPPAQTRQQSAVTTAGNPKTVVPSDAPPPLPQQPRTLPTPAATGLVALQPGPGNEVRSLVRGQRLRLSEIVPGEPPPAFAVGLEIAAPSGVSVDRCCFGLDENGKLSDDRYLVFYNQKESPEGAISMRGAWREVFQVELARLPSTIRRLMFTATVDGKGSLRQLGASRLELHPMGGTGGARYEFSGNDLDDVKALMIAEIYYKDGWRLAAVGQGFAGGLSELLKHFGGQEV